MMPFIVRLRLLFFFFSITFTSALGGAVDAMEGRCFFFSLYRKYEETLLSQKSFSRRNARDSHCEGPHTVWYGMSWARATGSRAYGIKENRRNNKSQRRFSSREAVRSLSPFPGCSILRRVLPGGRRCQFEASAELEKLRHRYDPLNAELHATHLRSKHYE